MIRRLKKVAVHRDELIVAEKSRSGGKPVSSSDEQGLPMLPEREGAQAAE
jgi:hypothetical protein